ncbi:HAD-like domain [Pseudocohnilembus persalinus]|uniref:HAD-like domain n=1 Tax=Pseudocohnilembus persalinus TaxID=266149 RepID=A0A0V0QAF1_PSEPJ|nr:HAD-like domain [Pseudocohnilembus persalinus]|eukprot:KRW99047.1 HAD-like domain [Pseudocohnilembus persalinus]
MQKKQLQNKDNQQDQNGIILQFTKGQKAANSDCQSQSDLELQSQNQDQKDIIQQFVIEQAPQHKGKKTLVLDLDETLVHSSIYEMEDYDHKFQITVFGQQYTISVRLRTGCLEFLKEMAQFYEIFVYTASLKEYADPVIDLIDPEQVVVQRLYREHCTKVKNDLFVKDMTQLNREVKDIILVDNSEVSFLFQPENALHIKNFYEDRQDIELFRYMPFLKFLAMCNDVRDVKKWLEIFESKDKIIYENPKLQKLEIDKKEIIKHFQQQYPQQFQQYQSQEFESEDLPLTARRQEVNEKVQEEPDYDFGDDNLDSHKGMLRKHKLQHNYSQIQLENKQNQQKDKDDLENQSIDSDVYQSQEEEEQQQQKQQQNEITIKNNQSYNNKQKQINNNQQNSDNTTLNTEIQNYQNNNNTYKESLNTGGLMIEIDEGQDENQPPAKESTTAFLAKKENKSHNIFLSKNNINQQKNKKNSIQKSKQKAKEYEDTHIFQIKTNQDNQQQLLTQQININDQQDQQGTEIARKELFGDNRFSGNAQINFNSPLAGNTKIQFLSKNKIIQQQKQQENEEMKQNNNEGQIQEKGEKIIIQNEEIESNNVNQSEIQQQQQQQQQQSILQQSQNGTNSEYNYPNQIKNNTYKINDINIQENNISEPILDNDDQANQQQIQKQNNDINFINDLKEDGEQISGFQDKKEINNILKNEKEKEIVNNSNKNKNEQAQQQVVSN